LSRAPALDEASGEAQAGRRYLSDMKPMAAVNFPFTAIIPMRWSFPQELPPPRFGIHVVVGGVFSPHGIFMHAGPPPHEGDGPPIRKEPEELWGEKEGEGPPPIPTSTSYRLERKYRVFDSRVALNDSVVEGHVPGMQSMTFRVYRDGKEAWKSEPVVKRQDVQHCRISVAGIEVLKLEVQFPIIPHGAHAAWYEPYVSP
jgi:hypothetical protein